MGLSRKAVVSSKAILFGLLVSIVLFPILAVLSVIPAGITFKLFCLEYSSAIGSEFDNSVMLALFSLLLELLCALWGGYVASSLAPHSKLLHSAIVGVVTALVGVILFILKPTPVWLNTIYCGLVLPISLLGGHMSKKEHSMHNLLLWIVVTLQLLILSFQIYSRIYDLGRQKENDASYQELQKSYREQFELYKKNLHSPKKQPHEETVK